MPSPSAKQRRFMAAAAHDPAFARKAGITYNTVRTLLRRAMARTGSRSQD